MCAIVIVGFEKAELVPVRYPDGPSVCVHYAARANRLRAGRAKRGKSSPPELRRTWQILAGTIARGAALPHCSQLADGLDGTGHVGEHHRALPQTLALVHAGACQIESEPLAINAPLACNPAPVLDESAITECEMRFLG